MAFFLAGAGGQVRNALLTRTLGGYTAGVIARVRRARTQAITKKVETIRSLHGADSVINLVQISHQTRPLLLEIHQIWTPNIGFCFICLSFSSHKNLFIDDNCNHTFHPNCYNSLYHGAPYLPCPVCETKNDPSIPVLIVPSPPS